MPPELDLTIQPQQSASSVPHPHLISPSSSTASSSSLADAVTFVAKTLGSTPAPVGLRAMKRSPALYGFNELLARTDEELRDILASQPKRAAGSPFGPLGGVGTLQGPGATGEGGVDSEDEEEMTSPPVVAVNDDYLYPDAITPSKVENELAHEYDIPFMDDEAFGIIDQDYFQPEEEELKARKRLPPLEGMERAFASDEDLTSICESGE